MGTQKNVDVVFVVDASASMKPTFDQLRKHINSMLTPIIKSGSNVRLGLVAHRAGETDDGGAVYQFSGIGGHSVIDALYQKSPNDSDEQGLFTRDLKIFVESLDRISPAGDEETLIALDCALDFPFGPLASTKRVLVLLTDEPLEDGVSRGECGDKIMELIEKVHARHINMFLVLPESEQANRLVYADRAEVEFIQGGDGLASVRFDLLLGQIGKSISVPSLQTTTEPAFKRALYDQNQWADTDSRMPEQDNR